MYEITGVDYEFQPLQGAGHATWDAKVEGTSLFDMVFDFIVKQQSLVVE